ncbi:hypothetical protein PS15m_010164 [Mucor circinelloides]
MSIEGISGGPYYPQSAAGSAAIDDTDMTDAYVTSSDDQQDWENAIIFEHFDTNYEYSNIQEFGISLIKLLNQNGVSREVQRKLVEHINLNLLSKFKSNAIPALGGFLRSQESIHALISRGTQALSKSYHVCPSGCKLYPAETAYPIRRQHCSSPRYKNHNQALSLNAQFMDLDAEDAPGL